MDSPPIRLLPMAPNQDPPSYGLLEDVEMQTDNESQQLQSFVHPVASFKAYPLVQNQEISSRYLPKNSEMVQDTPPAQENPIFPLPTTSAEAYTFAKCLVSYEQAANINQQPNKDETSLLCPTYFHSSGNALWDILKRGGYVYFATNVVKLNSIRLNTSRLKKGKIDQAWKTMVAEKSVLWNETCGMDEDEWIELATELSKDCFTRESERWWREEKANWNGILGGKGSQMSKAETKRLRKEKYKEKVLLKAERAKMNSIFGEQTKGQIKAARRKEKRKLLSKEENEKKLLLKVEEKTTTNSDSRLKAKQLKKQSAEKMEMEKGMKKRERRKKKKSLQKNVSASEENLRVVKELQSMEEENGEQTLVSMFSALAFLPRPKAVAEAGMNM